MRTPVVKMTAGDYLYRQPGFLNSINLSIEQDYPWELESGNGVYQLPHVIKADCQFTPLHDFLPRRLTPGILGKSLINQKRDIQYKTTIEQNRTNLINQALNNAANTLNNNAFNADTAQPDINE